MIDDSTRQQILDAAQIVDVVADFVHLRKKGANYIGLCPFHNDRNPSFHVSPSKNICKCFVCGEGGTPVSFVMKMEKKNYSDALRYIAAKYNIPIQEVEETEEIRKKRDERESLFIANQVAHRFFSNQIFDSVEGKSMGLTYFEKRGIRRETIEKFGLGYAPMDRSLLFDYISQEGFSVDAFAQVGLCYPPEEGKPGADRFRHRVMYPIHTISGRVVGFGGRALVNKEKVAKYINSPESPIYNKSQELYGIYFAKKDITKEDKCIIVEGYMDVLSLHQKGICNVVATSGTALTDQQIKLIRRFTKNITIIFDGDSAGIKAAIRGVDLLLEAGINTRVLLLPDGEDPDSFAQSHTYEEVKNYFEKNEQDFISFKLDLNGREIKKNPSSQASLINDIIKSISLIPDPIQRRIYIQTTAQSFGVEEQLVLRQVKYFRDSQKTRPGETYHSHAELPNHQTNPEENSDEFVKATEPPMALFEKGIIDLIIRYGGECLEFSTDGENESSSRVPIARLILNELNQDGIRLGSPTFWNILKEANDQIDAWETNNTGSQPAFDTVRYFSNHPSAYISHLAIDLLSNPYRLSREAQRQMGIREEDTPPQSFLQERTVREIYAFKIEYILQEIRQIRQLILEKQNKGLENEIPPLLQRMMELNEAKKLFASELGERVII